jgi:hypothetical protein
MSTRHKKQLTAAWKDLAEREIDLVAYKRVIAGMTNQGFPPRTRAPIVIKCRDAARRDLTRLRRVIRDLERALLPCT